MSWVLMMRWMCICRRRAIQNSTDPVLSVPFRTHEHRATGFLDNHPGGKEILLLAAGRDITYAFDSYHPFTEKPNQGAHD